MNEAPPFVIFALPRSRTYWCSRFLTYGGWICGHEEIKHLRSLDDVRSWLSMPMTGTAETIGAPFWRYLMQARPDCRIVTIRRRWQDSLTSLLNLGVPFREDTLALQLRRLDAKLDQIEARVPGVLRLGFDDLATEEGCQALFEHCLGVPFNRDWWQAYAPLNLQIDVPALFRYMRAHRAQLEKLGKIVRHTCMATMRPKRTFERGVVLNVEPYSDALCQEAVPLLKDHMVLMDLDPDDWSKRPTALYQRLQDLGQLQCVVARINGRMFGYLVSIVAPSFDIAGETEALHTIFFADKSVFGLGLQMQAYAVEQLKARGVDDVYMRTGNRTASAPKLGTMYERMGALRVGEMYRLPLREVA